MSTKLIPSRTVKFTFKLPEHTALRFKKRFPKLGERSEFLRRMINYSIFHVHKEKSKGGEDFARKIWEAARKRYEEPRGLRKEEGEEESPSTTTGRIKGTGKGNISESLKGGLGRDE